MKSFIRFHVILPLLIFVALSACKKNNPNSPAKTNQCAGPEILSENVLPDYLLNTDGSLSSTDAITGDTYGNVYIVNATGPFTSGANPIAGLSPGYLKKFNEKGELLYSKAITTSYSVSIGVDSLQEVYSGYFTIANPWNCIVNTIKYNNSGDTIWSKHIYYDSDALFDCLNVESDGTVYVASEAYSHPLDVVYDDPTVQGESGSGYMMYKFGPDGNLMKVKQMQSAAIGKHAYRFFPSGSFYNLNYGFNTTASPEITQYDKNFNTISVNDKIVASDILNVIFDNQSNPFVVDSTSITRVDVNNNTLWKINTQPYKSITTDAAGNLYISGIFNGRVNFGTGSTAKYLQANGKNDSFIEKFDPNGKMLWVVQSLGTDGKTYTGASQIDQFIVTAKNELFITGTALNAKTNTNIHFAALYTQCN